MDLLLSFVLAVFVALGIAEAACFWLFHAGYFRLGRASQREDWQSGVPVEVAHSAVGRLLETGEIAGCRKDDLYCFRPSGWEWGPMPRSVLLISEGPAGATYTYEVRACAAVLWLALAFATYLALSGHELFGAVMGLAVVPYFVLSWRLSLESWGRLRPIRRALKQVGVQVCEHCGYDMHGVPPSHPCPECGRFSDGRSGRPNLDRIRRQVDRRADLLRWRGLFMIGMGAVILLFMSWLVAIPTGGVVFASRARDAASWWMLTGIVAVIVGVAGFIAAIREGVHTFDVEPVRMDEPVLMRPYRGWLSGSVIRMFAGFLLLGPRLMYEGLELIREASTRGVDPGRAARMLMELLGRSTSVLIDDLRELEEYAEGTKRVAEWLRRQGWVGLTEHGGRIFLFTESRDVLHSGD